MDDKDKQIPTEELFRENLGKIAYMLDKEYFSRLDEDYCVLPYDEYYNSEEIVDESGEKKRIEINSYVSNIRALKILRLVYDKNENFSDCFQNAISIFAHTGNTIAFVFNRFIDRTEIYAIVRNDGPGKNEESKANIYLLRDSLKGNFPGTKMQVIEENDEGNDTKKIFSDREGSLNIGSIAAVCNIPSAKSEKYFSQNLEKLFNGIVPENAKEWYSVIVFAESYTPQRIHQIREGLEELSSNIFPFRQHQFQTGESKAETQGEMKSLSHSDNTSIAISKTHSVNVGVNGSRFSSTSLGIGSNLASLALTEGSSHGGSLGYGYSWGKTETRGESDTYTNGTNSSITLGSSDSTTYSFQSYTVKNILDRLEQYLQRIQKGEAIGLWKYATFVCAHESRISRNVANYIRALTGGEQSYSEPSIIKEWQKSSGNGTTDFEQIEKYILNFTHPVFVNKVDGTPVNFSANINTAELVNAFPLPQHSIAGVPVTNGASFGREPHSLQKEDFDLDIGCAYHLYQKNNAIRVKLSKKQLTKHTFISGSTGSGKSNTIYKLLDTLARDKVHFLVIEPAKGEYKEVLGKKKGVITYGTNPLLKDIELLRINPFRFPKRIHVLEHMDRLVEIFNVCWPMYAAMPAILKDAIERAYKVAGWDLEKSRNDEEPERYPSFADVLVQIRNVLKESDYSDDNKGDYTGALVTRLRSLTNGINGLIFSKDDLTDAELFDTNAIVDLSRVGSTETKALIMGILVLKLQEHRMEQRADAPDLNSDLRHITVLEEAHNLLRRTSVEQTPEGANLLGKSVEMLSNSIAEMRTYGEGFIIADQSPGLMDMSVIRNTNTKIIMRLPDLSDRELVGKAAGLNDDQIVELSRLERGVASITQNDWIEPVLCMIDRYNPQQSPDELFKNYDESITKGRKPRRDSDRDSDTKRSLLECIMTKELYRKGDRTDIKKLRNDIVRSNLDATVKRDFIRYINSGEDEAVITLRELAYDFFSAEKAIEASRGIDDINRWVHKVVDGFNPSVRAYSPEQINLLICLIIQEQTLRNVEYADLFCRFIEIYSKKGRVF